MSEADPRAQIERLEARIEELTDTVTSCRKIMAGARIAIGVGVAWSLALLLGLLWFEALQLVIAITFALGGIVLYGSNSSTLDQTQTAIREAEARRAELIGAIRLRVVE